MSAIMTAEDYRALERVIEALKGFMLQGTQASEPLIKDVRAYRFAQPSAVPQVRKGPIGHNVATGIDHL